MSRSGYCLPWPHTTGHATCQRRQADPDERTRINPCDCDMHGGHGMRATDEGDDD